MAQSPNNPGEGGANFVKEIVADPKNVPDVMLLYGYLGASSEEAHERLYLSPDLSNYVEVPVKAILHRAQAAKEQDPNGGVTLWVKKDAALKYKMAPAQQALAHYFAGAIAAGAAGAAAPPQGAGAAAAAIPGGLGSEVICVTWGLCTHTLGAHCTFVAPICQYSIGCTRVEPGCGVGVRPEAAAQATAGICTITAFGQCTPFGPPCPVYSLGGDCAGTFVGCPPTRYPCTAVPNCQHTRETPCQPFAPAAVQAAQPALQHLFSLPHQCPPTLLPAQCTIACSFAPCVHSPGPFCLQSIGFACSVVCGGGPQGIGFEAAQLCAAGTLQPTTTVQPTHLFLCHPTWVGVSCNIACLPSVHPACVTHNPALCTIASGVAACPQTGPGTPVQQAQAAVGGPSPMCAPELFIKPAVNPTQAVTCGLFCWPTTICFSPYCPW